MANSVEIVSPYLFRYKGFVFAHGDTTPEYINSLQDFEIRDSDVFLVTYPKSGTVWTQQIITLLYEGEVEEATQRAGLTYSNNLERMPWLEFRGDRSDYSLRPSPRLFCSHLTPTLLPRGLREGKGKVVYVMRNPKDVAVSYYHFSQAMTKLETPRSFQDLLDKYLEGNVGGSSWFDHVRTWHSSKGLFNILFLTYEEMVQDLRGAVQKLCTFLGRQLDSTSLNRVVDRATFRNMRADPRANYEFLPADLLLREQGHFLRKGTTGDWKNSFTVAQSESFDSVFQERMRGLPLEFIWDINKQPE
ncbi:amine sulfotransferase [Amia ocellicauda]|uniref:amine sulfotransferase n=1 Tax=Amia ocellicauda TaxID=2972642 RepID=UPI0034639AD7